MIPSGTVYRYLDQPYVDDFKRFGRLRICVASTYHNTGDAREDPDDGVETTEISQGTVEIAEANAIFGEWHYGRLTLGAGATLRHRAHFRGYILCTSTVLHPRLSSHFRTDSHFEIVKPIEFGHALQKAVGAQTMVLGWAMAPVVYVSDRTRRATVRELVVRGQSLSTVPIERRFRKRAIPHEIEREFRYIIEVTREPVRTLFLQFDRADVVNCCRFPG